MRKTLLRTCDEDKDECEWLMVLLLHKDLKRKDLIEVVESARYLF